MARAKQPGSKPRLSTEALNKHLEKFDIDRKKYPLLIVGIRGYYLNSMGKRGKNDRGLYDDAIFIVTPNATVSFNANVDPSVFRKRIATLVPGIYYSYKFDTHRGSKSQYPAICQRKGKVTVSRDGWKNLDTGMFGINIHRGGWSTTSSLGCQTIPRTQWDAFYQLAKAEAKRLLGSRWNKATIPYVLLENKRGKIS